MAALLAMASVVVIVGSCTTDPVSYSDCDYVVRRCRMVCDYWYGGYGYYPTCWNQCWDECYRYPDPPPDPAMSDASAPPESDSSAPPTSDGGPQVALCTPCASNADCSSGGPCIVRGGPRADASAMDAGLTGFCGQSCSNATDCPSGFTCAQLGSSRQCLPAAGVCE
ncbi:MAG TPA: hypothetical protein VM925_28555 [Labilithrix sp.]|nr:hypothetical protein [Labilithrix sp.]